MAACLEPRTELIDDRSDPQQFSYADPLGAAEPRAGGSRVDAGLAFEVLCWHRQPL